MSCEEVREQLPDYSLSTLSDIETAAIRRHLRGCTACRTEAEKLDEGVALFGSVAHAMDPPADLKPKVMSVLAEEWAETSTSRTGLRRIGLRSWLAVAAVAVILAGALTWGTIAQSNAGRFQADALSYRQFLHSLGGRDVRTAALASRSSQVIEGSAVLYDSDKGQSWVLVMARAPGYSGAVNVSLSSPDGHTIAMRPIQIDADGSGASWLVTAADISRFETVRLLDATGRVLAAGTVVER